MQIQPNGGAITQQTLAALSLVSNSVFPTQGNQWFVAPHSGSDTNNSGTTPGSAFKTLGQALSMATANQNDTIYMLAQSNTAAQTTDYQTATLNWNKDGVHLIGVNDNPLLGQRSRVAFDAAYATASNLFTLSANGCLIAGVEFYEESSVAVRK